VQRGEVEKKFKIWRADWCVFAAEVLQVNLDEEQKKILRSVQVNKRTTVASGTARGKDFVSAVAALCFFYLTPKWDEKGNLIENTKVALTAPTDRQIENIMVPEFTRLFQRAKFLPGRLVGYDIRTENKEWFLTGFKADDKNTEAWSGFHAANTMFIITEASGIPELVYNAIEGNLQGNSRILLVFNPNTPTGYAAMSQRSPDWNKFRLDSLNAPNVANKRSDIPGQVDYEWVLDKVKNWCTKIDKRDFLDSEGDFEFDGVFYRPNDLFRVKVRGMFPKVAEDVLIPAEWIEAANKRWAETSKPDGSLKLGVDVAGMGRDSSCFCYRYDNYVHKFKKIQSAGKANHMEIAGIVANELNQDSAAAYIDTIGEGAGTYSRLEELGYENAISCKYSESAKGFGNEYLTDLTGQYTFANMRAYLFWAARDWLNPVNNTGAALPEDDELLQEACEIKWKFQSNGRIIIEPKEDIKKRIKRSTDKFDSLANTFYPDMQSKVSFIYV